MELTKKEKAAIFWALMEKYPMHERGRGQAKHFFSDDPERLKEALAQINEAEKESYDLAKKFADEINMTLPEYKNPE